MLFQNGVIFFVIVVTYVIVPGFSQTASFEGTTLQTSNSVLDFDTNSKELSSNYQVRAKNPQRITLTSEVNCKFWMFPTPPSGSIISYKDL